MNDRNYLYATHKNVAASLASYIKNRNIGLDDIYSWCSEAISLYIADIEFMWTYNEMGFEIIGGRILIPCNCFRIINVYNSGEKELSFFNNGAYLSDIKLNGTNLEDGDIIYLNYTGTPVDEDGLLIIPLTFVPACEFFCQSKIYFEDYIEGKMSESKYNTIIARFDNSSRAGRNSYRGLTTNWINKNKIIRGNMLPAIGGIPLIHKI